MMDVGLIWPHIAPRCHVIQSLNIKQQTKYFAFMAFIALLYQCDDFEQKYHYIYITTKNMYKKINCSWNETHCNDTGYNYKWNYKTSLMKYMIKSILY